MKISYVTLGTNDRAKAETFYDTLLADSPFEKNYSEDRMTMWVNDKQQHLEESQRLRWGCPVTSWHCRL
jgi:hypothetical protein